MTSKAMSKATPKTLSTPKMSSMSNTLSKSNTVNKERNKRSKGSGYVSKKFNKKNIQNPIQNQVIQMRFLLQTVNRLRKGHRLQIRFQSMILLINKGIK